MSYIEAAIEKITAVKEWLDDRAQTGRDAMPGDCLRNAEVLRDALKLLEAELE